MKSAGCMGEVDPPLLLQRWVEVLKSLGRTESPVLRPRWGQREFLGWFLSSGREPAGVQELSNYAILVTGELFVCAV